MCVIATLEAMAAGNPVVVSHQPDKFQNGAMEYVEHGDNGLVTDGQVSSLAQAMGTALSDEALYSRLSSNAVATAERYTWDEAVTVLEGIYNHLLAQSS